MSHLRNSQIFVVCLLVLSLGGWMNFGLMTPPWMGLLLVSSLAVIAATIAVARWFRDRGSLNKEECVPEYFRSALDGLNEGTLLLTYSGQIEFANRAFLSLSGYTLSEIKDKKVRELSWRWGDLGEQGDLMPEITWLDAVRQGVCRTGRVTGLPSGTQALFKMNSVPITAPDGVVRGAMVSFQDVTGLLRKKEEIASLMETVRTSSARLRQMTEQLDAMVVRDPVTGCYLRQSAINQLQRNWEGARQQDLKYACLLVDVDHFRVLNEEYGFEAGDRILKALGGLLMQEAGEDALVCRFDGEKFLVVLDSIDANGAVVVAGSLRQKVSRIQVGEITFTISVGISGSEDDHACLESLLSACEESLSRAKIRGRNQVCRWSSETVQKNLDSMPGQLPAEVSSIIPYPAVAALFSALSYRDFSTAAHSRRVADLCQSVGQRVMSQSSCYVLEMSALLHDIGKIGVPDALLRKVTPLTDDEWAIMRDHDRIGVEIIRTAFATPELTAIVENYTRSYAESIRENTSLPLGAKILAVVDAYDSMTNHQIYRSAISPDDAIAELRRCAGSQFDPEIVEHVAEILYLHQRDASSAVALDTDVAREIGMELESLAEAVDSQDIVKLRSIASRLCTIGNACGAPEIGMKAMELEETSFTGADRIGVFQSANELLNYCRAVTLRTAVMSSTPSLT